MQMEDVHSTAGHTTTAATDIGRRADKTEVPVEYRTAGTLADAELGSDKAEHAYSREDLESAIEILREYTGWGNFNIDFSLDDETESMVIKIIDRKSGETLRQIPPDQILKLKGHMKEMLGLIFDHLA